MAITYRTRKFTIPLKVNKAAESIKIALADLDLDGETIALRDAADNAVTTYEFDSSSSLSDGSLNAGNKVVVGIKNLSTIKAIAERFVQCAKAFQPDTLLIGSDAEGLVIKQQVKGDIVTAVVSDALKLVITEVVAGSDGADNPDINAGVATLIADSSNLGFNPAIDTLKLQVNCNDFEGSGAGEFDIAVRPAGSEVYAPAAIDNIAGTDVVIIGGQSNSIVFDGVKVDVSGLTGSDANIYLTFIQEEKK